MTHTMWRKAEPRYWSRPTFPLPLPPGLTATRVAVYALEAFVTFLSVGVARRTIFARYIKTYYNLRTSRDTQIVRRRRRTRARSYYIYISLRPPVIIGFSYTRRSRFRTFFHYYATKRIRARVSLSKYRRITVNTRRTLTGRNENVRRFVATVREQIMYRRVLVTPGRRTIAARGEPNANSHSFSR